MDFTGIQETQLDDSREVWMEPVGSKSHFFGMLYHLAVGHVDGYWEFKMRIMR
jgi:hypothetical protein